MTLRSWLRGTDLPERDDFTLRAAFAWASRLLFFAVMGILVLLSMAADGALAVAAITAILAQLLYIVLPVTKIRNTGNALLSGNAGRETYDELEEQTDQTSTRLQRWFK